MVRFVNDPELAAHTELLPPRELPVDGVVRSRNREVTPEDAVRLARRGLRSFVLGFGFGAEVSADELASAVEKYRSHFDGMDPGHGPEAMADIYGRRDPRTREDTRIVVVSILNLDIKGEAGCAERGDRDRPESASA